MRRALILAAALAGLLAFAAPAAQAQRLATALSARTISIDSSFSGEILTLFGNIEPAFDGAPVDTRLGYDVVVVVEGPTIDRVVRKQTSNFGIWLNTEQIRFNALPSYYWVFSSGRLESVTTPEVIEEHSLLPEVQPALVQQEGVGDPEELGTELVRLMRNARLYGVEENGVQFRSPTLFSASLTLPSNVPNGSFLAQVYLFQDERLLSVSTQGFVVRKTGIERIAGTTAQSMPLVYGLFCVVLALFTGWLGGVVFRR